MTYDMEMQALKMQTSFLIRFCKQQMYPAIKT
jgi:hypothetical protein